MGHRLQKAHKDTKEFFDILKKKNKEYYDKQSNVTDFKVGDKVKVQNEPYKKFQYIYSDPFEVIKVEESNFIMNLNGKSYKIHKNRINKY